jgi:Domain of unknown function (DUF6468)
MNFSIILDLVVIVCLISTIIYAILLNKRLTAVYKSRDELQGFLQQFTTSMQKADANIQDLKGIGESVFRDAEVQLEKAAVLKDDLCFLNERGEELAERLDNAIRSARELQRDLEGKTANLARGIAVRPQDTHMFHEENDESQPELVRYLKNVR